MMCCYRNIPQPNESEKGGEPETKYINIPQTAQNLNVEENPQVINTLCCHVSVGLET